MLRRTLLVCAGLAVAVALLVDHAAQLGPDMTNVALLGAALGAVAGLVPDGTPFARIAGAFVGMVLAQVGYGVRAALLPDIPAGRAIAAAVVVLVLTAVVAATPPRPPRAPQPHQAVVAASRRRCLRRCLRDRLRREPDDLRGRLVRHGDRR